MIIYRSDGNGFYKTVYRAKKLIHGPRDDKTREKKKKIGREKKMQMIKEKKDDE